jgi:hypothetical protein
MPNGQEMFLHVKHCNFQEIGEYGSVGWLNRMSFVSMFGGTLKEGAVGAEAWRVETPAAT